MPNALIAQARRLARILSPEKKPTKERVRLAYTNKSKAIKKKLVYLYGKEQGEFIFERIEAKMRAFTKKKPRRLKQADAKFSSINRFTQKDTLLITYANSICKKNEDPLQSLYNFAHHHLKDSINSIHILPFFPYSSDRGFSIINYKKVDSDYGTWREVKKLGEEYNLMFDGVFNHMSAKSTWFKGYLRGSKLYENHFISYEHKNDISPEDMKKILRPRTTPLLTEFKTHQGTRYIWTTFSPDQVDLNFKETRVLLRIIDVLLRYVRNGARLIRLDAVNYLWKQLGTSCAHLKQTHVIIQLLRDILDIVAPSVSLVTETNVPHAQNIKYLGTGKNEAQMIYNFSLPPLVLYTFYKGSTKYLSRWANRLEKVSDYATYFNFLDSHDGIGLRGASRVLPKPQVKFLVKHAKKHGSLVSYRSTGTGGRSPYELNVTWWNAINGEKKDHSRFPIIKYIASRAIALSLKGVPGIYILGLLGIKNDNRTVKRTKVLRDINRKNLDYDDIMRSVEKNPRLKGVLARMTEMVKIRSQHKAFHPNAEQQILFQNDAIFSLLRTSTDEKERILVLINVTDKEQQFTVDCKELKMPTKHLYDLLSKKRLSGHDSRLELHAFTLTLKPYEVRWIRASE